MKIFLAAAHGGGDPGASANNTTEAEEVKKIVDQTVKLLTGQLPATAELVQVPDELNLEGEVKFINENAVEAPSDVCIEVNMNSNVGAPGTGIETYYGEQELAKKVHEVLVKETGLRDRGIKYGMNLYFNNATYPPSALVELGFVNNPSDLAIVRQKGALALAKAIALLTGKILPTNPPPPPPTPGVDYQKLYETLRDRIAEAIATVERMKDNPS